MGTTIKDIIQLDIKRGSTKLSRAGFGTQLYVGSVTFPEDYRVYSSIDDVDADNDAGYFSEAIYKMLSQAYIQDLVPEKIKVLKRPANAVQEILVTVEVVANSTEYQYSLNGTVYSVISDASATAVEIASALVADIGVQAGLTITDGLDGTFTIQSNTAGTGFTYLAGEGLSDTIVQENVNISTALSDMEDQDSDWYCINIEHNADPDIFEADILAVAQWVEPRIKLFVVSTQNAEYLTTSTSNTFSTLKTLGYERTVGIYSSTANTEYIESALCSRCLPEDAGSITWKFKQLKGITPDIFGTNKANLDAKNLNYYETLLGVNCITSDAKVLSGEYIDIIRGSDQLQARIEEDTFQTLLDAGKVPYDDDGYSMIAGPLRARLEEARINKFIKSYTVVVPKADDRPAQDRANRIADGITFEAPLAGAIHKAKIQGTLTI